MDNRGFQEEVDPDYSIPRVSLKNKNYSTPEPHIYNSPEQVMPFQTNLNQIHDPNLNGTATYFKNPMEIDAMPKKPLSDDQEEEDEVSGDSFEDLEWKPTSPLSKAINVMQNSIESCIHKSRGGIKTAIILFIFALYNIYLAGTIVHNRRYDLPIEWCDGLGFLIIITAIVYWSLFYYHVLKRFAGDAIYKAVFVPIGKFWDKCWKLLPFRLIFLAIIIGGVLTFLVIDTKDNRRRLISASGIPVILLIGLIISKHPARVVWRHVFWGTALQFVFGLLILKWDTGKNILECISGKVETFLKFADEGSSFVYGFVATGYSDENITLQGTFAFGILSVIFYFSFVVALLYHVGAMSWVVIKIGWLLQVTVGTTAAESMSAAANIFLGQTEAPLVIKPFINDLTNSELHAVMTGGFSTIAGTVMGAFISFGISASHLLSASFMSAPAALALAKLIHPETKVSKTTAETIQSKAASDKSKNSNFLDAASEGAAQAVHLVANIIASLVAVTAFVAFLNAILTWFGVLIGFHEFSFQWILTKLFYPFAVIIGIESEEIEDVSFLLGLKTVVNEFVAYERLAATELSPRSKAIATYGLCSFANFSSIGIQLGGLGAMAPKRRKDLAKTIWRAFIAGNLACLMTACIAGTLTTEMGYDEWKQQNTTILTSRSITSGLF